MPAIRAIVGRADPNLPVFEIERLQAILDRQTAPRTAQLRLVGVFAIAALLLAGIGLHGLLSFSVSSQLREIGVRIALGAGPRRIATMVVGHGIALAALGTAVGVAVAYGVGRWMETLLAGVSPVDLPAYAGAIALVALVTVTGTVVPAARAMCVDPLTAIRTE